MRAQAGRRGCEVGGSVFVSGWGSAPRRLSSAHLVRLTDGHGSAAAHPVPSTLRRLRRGPGGYRLTAV